MLNRRPGSGEDYPGQEDDFGGGLDGLFGGGDGLNGAVGDGYGDGATTHVMPGVTSDDAD